MPDTRDPQSVILAAEQAAVGGDDASAEQLLREAADLQEASLGPLHPELANTLNNLGVVYEVTEKPEEAERCFRRASEIAAAVLPPDHPFVATSRQNLEDFLKTKVKPAADAAASPPPVPPHRATARCSNSGSQAAPNPSRLHRSSRHPSHRIGRAAETSAADDSATRGVEHGSDASSIDRRPPFRRTCRGVRCGQAALWRPMNEPASSAPARPVVAPEPKPAKPPPVNLRGMRRQAKGQS